MDNFTLYLSAAEDALANYLGTDELTDATVELVADCMRQAVSVLPNWSYFTNLLEKSSTYVQADLDELEMADYVGELETQMEEYGLL